MKSFLMGVVCLGFLASSNAAFAQTADGQTPAEEKVCDDYTGKAFGICNAYCEAIDCDDDPNASATACAQLETKFTAATGEKFPACDAGELCFDRCDADFELAQKLCADQKDAETCYAQAKEQYQACYKECEGGGPIGQECTADFEKQCIGSGGTIVKYEDGSCDCASR